MLHIAARLAAWLAATRADQEGQGLAEYSLILALIAMVAIAALMFLGQDITNSLTYVGETINSVRPH